MLVVFRLGSCEGEVAKVNCAQTGILSSVAARDKVKHFVQNYGGYNGNNRVSLAAHPNYHGYFPIAYQMYIKDGISFVVDPSIGPRRRWSGNHNSGFDDEEQAESMVALESIVGIMIPPEARDPISSCGYQT